MQNILVCWIYCVRLFLFTYTYTSKFVYVLSVFNSCKSTTFYTICDILHDRNLKHNYKLIYDIEINLHLDIKIYLHLFYKKNNLFY